MTRSKVYKVLFWILIVIAIGAAGVFAYSLTMSKINEKKNTELQGQVFTEKPDGGETKESETSSGSKYTYTIEADNSEERGEPIWGYDNNIDNPMDIQEEENPRYEYTEDYHCEIDFDGLHQINPDIYGWIVIENMDISYPLLQHPTEDQHYLVYSYDNTPGNTGSIYTHCNVSKTMTDFNTIIYGHNLYQGGWFTDLEMYYDEEFLREHRDITIYQEDKALHYKVYAAVVYSNVLIDAAFDFSKEEDRQAYIDSLGQTMDLRSHVMDDMEVTPKDNLITLSTCVSGVGSKRLLVIGVLTKVEALPQE